MQSRHQKGCSEETKSKKADAINRKFGSPVHKEGSEVAEYCFPHKAVVLDENGRAILIDVVIDMRQ